MKRSFDRVGDAKINPKNHAELACPGSCTYMKQIALCKQQRLVSRVTHYVISPHEADQGWILLIPLKPSASATSIAESGQRLG